MSGFQRRLPIPAGPLVVAGKPPIFRHSENRLPVSGRSIQFSPVDCFHYLELPAAGAVVIRDMATWRELWARFYKFNTDTTQLHSEKVPVVDFDSRVALVLSYPDVGGCFPWYDIVERLEEARDTLWVHLRSSSEVDLGHCHGFYEAFQVIDFPRSESPIVVTAPDPEQIEDRAGWFRYTNESR